MAKLLTFVAALAAAHAAAAVPIAQLDDAAVRTPRGLEATDLFIGTGGNGYGSVGLPVGAQVPFGAMRLSPDTTQLVDLPWQHTGGYTFSDNELWAFSHTHMVGAGVMDMGNIGVLPMTSEPGDKCARHECKERFKKNDGTEVATPGYYKMVLESGVKAEVTASAWVGVHRYTFPSTDKGFMVVDLGHCLRNPGTPQSIKNSTIEYTAGGFSGKLLNDGGYSSRFGGFEVYFAANVSAAATRTGTWNDGASITWGSASTSGNNTGLVLEFAPSTEPVILQLAISFISTEQARKNLAASAPNDFDATMAAAKSAWTQALDGVAQVAPGGDADDEVKFFTALYHAQMAPTQLAEPGSAGYRGFDKQVHALDAGQDGYFTDMSIWDTHRTQAPLMTLIQPAVSRDVVRSMLQMAAQGGDLPKWPFVTGYTGGMIGQHALPMIVDAFLKGIHLDDAESTYSLMVDTATQPRQHNGRSDLDHYLKAGYVSSDEHSKAACLTLAYAYDDHSIGCMACALNKTDDCATFTARGKNFANTFESSSKFFCPRKADGSFDCPLDLLNVFSDSFTEGDGWHYRFNAFHDPHGLMDLYGSNETFFLHWQTFLARSFDDETNILPNPYYWAGNEEDLAVPFVASALGRTDLTAYFVRQLLAKRFTTVPSGIPGNDDYGTMSSWFVWGAMGIYPVTGTGKYVLAGSCLFPSLKIASWTIKCDGLSATAIYPASVTINGVAWTSGPVIAHEHLQGDVSISFAMSDTPVREPFGSASA